MCFVLLCFILFKCVLEVGTYLVGCDTLTSRTALSSSQSLNIMSGDLPPSSRETFFKLLTAQLEKNKWEMNI